MEPMTPNGATAVTDPPWNPPEPSAPADLPAVLTLQSADANRVPSPGTQRELKAQTGRDWESFMAPEANSADRFQTIIWVALRKSHPGLRWDDCADVEMLIEDGPVTPDPLSAAGSAS